jgi:peptide/nickel transport system substrate-binding protein
MVQKAKWIGVLVLALAVSVGAMARTGAWFDEVVISEENNLGAGYARVAAGDADLHIFGFTDAAIFAQVRANPDLSYSRNVGSTSELTLNPAGPVFPGTGALNPFAVPAIREAMNYLVDRDYVANEIMGGLRCRSTRRLARRLPMRPCVTPRSTMRSLTRTPTTRRRQRRSSTKRCRRSAR